MGAYRIERVLGEGAQAKVYLATNQLLKRPTALKFFKRPPEQDSRVLREARIIAALEHPNIVRIYQLEHIDGLWFLATEYVNGGALSEHLTRGPLPADEVLHFAREAASALAHAHTHGVLHNDLKPQNFLLCIRGEERALKLADFGLASAAGATGAGGTPLYMAPELWRNQGPSPRSDLYSLGACLFHLATGKPPFAPGPSEVLREAHERQPVHPPGHLPLLLRQLISRLLAKDPDERPASAAELLEHFQHVEGQLSPPAEAASWPLRAAEEYLGELPVLKKAIDQLGAVIGTLPPILMMHCRHPQTVGFLIRRGLEASPGIKLIERFLVQAEQSDACATRFETLSKRIGPPGVVHIHLERAFTSEEADRVMQLASLGLVSLLVSGSADCLDPLKDQLRATGSQALGRDLYLPRFGEPELKRFLVQVVRCASLKGFTAEALRQLLPYESTAPKDFERIIHNAVAISRLSRQAFVTSWSVEGAVAHEGRINSAGDILPAWRALPRAWPPERAVGSSIPPTDSTDHQDS